MSYTRKTIEYYGALPQRPAWGSVMLVAVIATLADFAVTLFLFPSNAAPASWSKHVAHALTVGLAMAIVPHGFCADLETAP